MIVLSGAHSKMACFRRREPLCSSKQYAHASFECCLRAHTLFHRDVDYIVQNNQIIIIDEHTGRMMIGRRWSDGLHQAIEQKNVFPFKMKIKH